jgi:hypothetical protein
VDREKLLRDMPEQQASFTGKIPAHRTLLRMRNLLGNEHEGDRLLLPGLRTLHEAPSPRRIFLGQALGNFFLFSLLIIGEGPTLK